MEALLAEVKEKADQRNAEVFADLLSHETVSEEYVYDEYDRWGPPSE